MMDRRRVRDVVFGIGVLCCIGVVALTILNSRSLWDIISGSVIASCLAVPTMVVGYVKHLTKEAKVVWLLVLCALAVMNIFAAVFTSELLIAVLPTLGLVFLAIVIVPEPIPGRCLTCDYDLTGNVSGRCPECGEPVTIEGDADQDKLRLS